MNHRRRGSRTGDETFHPLWIEEGTAEIGKEMSSRLAWERAGGPAAGERAYGDAMRLALRETAPEFYGVFGMMSRTVQAFTPDPNGIAFEPNDQGHVYGSGWHFHRFLRDWVAGGEAGMDMAGDEALVTALNDSLTVPGIEGIEDVMGMTMEELLHAHAYRDDRCGLRGPADRRRYAALHILRLPHRHGDLHQPRSTGGVTRGPGR